MKIPERLCRDCKYHKLPADAHPCLGCHAPDKLCFVSAEEQLYTTGETILVRDEVTERWAERVFETVLPDNRVLCKSAGSNMYRTWAMSKKLLPKTKEIIQYQFVLRDQYKPQIAAGVSRFMTEKEASEHPYTKDRLVWTRREVITFEED